MHGEDCWQVSFPIPKGAADEIRKRGIEQFRADIAKLEPVLRDRVSELRDWNDVSLLTVRVDRLTRWWCPGLLCIGDAAHAMSPVGGVGINLAIQDAVAAANLLAEKLAAGRIDDADLRSVQLGGERPAQLTQKAQVFLHRHLLKKIFASPQTISPPWPMWLLERFPRL